MDMDRKININEPQAADDDSQIEDALLLIRRVMLDDQLVPDFPWTKVNEGISLLADNLTTTDEKKYEAVLASLIKISWLAPNLGDDTKTQSNQDLAGFLALKKTADHLNVFDARMNATQYVSLHQDFEMIEILLKKKTSEVDPGIEPRVFELIKKNEARILHNVRGGSNTAISLFIEYFGQIDDDQHLVDFIHQFMEKEHFVLKLQLLEQMNKKNNALKVRQLAQTERLHILGTPPFSFTSQEIDELWASWKKEDSASEILGEDPGTVNFGAMYQLEKEEPGCTRYLMKNFNIHFFARYPQSVLIEQYRKRDDVDTEYGIVLYPEWDDTGGFYETQDMLASVSNQIKKLGKYTLRIYECSNLFALGRAVVHAHSHYGKINFAIIGGHGTPFSIRFGKYDKLTAKDVRNGKGIQRSKELFVDNPSIALISCSTGQGKGSIAQRISQIGAFVGAPKDTTYTESITATKEGDNIRLAATYSEIGTSNFSRGMRLRDS
jgi:hypothetical protein